jgi:hypothetical protein
LLAEIAMPRTPPNRISPRTSRTVASAWSNPLARRMQAAATTGPSVLPTAMPAATTSELPISALTANAPRKIAGQTRGP